MLPKTWCFQNILLINLSHCLTMVQQLIRVMVHSRSILRPPRTSKLLDRSLSPAIWPPSRCSTNLLISSNHVEFYMIKIQYSSSYFHSQKLDSKFWLYRSRPFCPEGWGITRVVVVSNGFKRFVWLVLRLEISAFVGYLWLVN